MVVVDFGGGLAGMRAHDPACVLDQASLERDRRGEEERVQDRAVESFADEWSGGDDQQWCAVGWCVESGEGVAAGRGAHAAAQHDRVERTLPELVSEPFDAGCPLGEQQAAPAAFQRGDHVIDDLGEAGVVGDEVAVDGRHAAGLRRVGVTEVAVGGVVHVEYGGRALGGLFKFELGRAVLAWWRGLGDGVADRTQLEGDQVIELVAAVRGGGEPEPAAGRDLLDGVLERRSGDVVALVHDDQPIAAGELLDVGLAGQCLQHRDIDHPTGFAATAAELAGRDTQQVADAGPPLVGQGLAVDKHASVEVAWVAIIAQAITVLPAPGGVTSTPRSWSRRSSTAPCCSRVSVAVNVNSHASSACRSSVTSRRLPACSTSEAIVSCRPRGRTNRRPEFRRSCAGTAACPR